MNTTGLCVYNPTRIAKIFFFLTFLVSPLIFSQVFAGSTPPPPPTVGTPVISPNGGTHNNFIIVGLSTVTSGASIHYTIDGTTPTSASTLYAGTFTLSSTATVRAIGVKSSYTNSAISSATFTIIETVATPTANPNGGTFVDSVSISLSSATAGADIYYTLDGSTPSSSSTLFSSNITLTNNATVKFIGIKNGYTDSFVGEAFFSVSSSGGSGGSGGSGTTPSPNDSVGSIPGEFSVNNSGTANYSVPITVPLGTAGIEPKISLNYSNRGRNGLLGVGWVIAGLSVIHRCPTNLVKDGFIDGIDFDDNDRFCLDGQPLIAINGTYGASGTEYRTEINNFSKIISYGSTGSGPSYFKVWTKSGEIMEYGNTNDSQINPPLADGSLQSDAICWLLNKTTDTVGNYMTVTYFEDESTGENYPSIIDYTGNSSASVSPYNSVEFTYESRPDVGTRYLAGLKMESTKRLKKIEINHSASSIRNYQITYTESDLSGRSNIEQIDSCDSNNNCLPSTNFQTVNGTNQFALDQAYSNSIADTYFEISGSSFAGLGTGFDAGTRIADVNGDGIADLIELYLKNGVPLSRVYLNSGTALTFDQSYSSSLPDMYFAFTTTSNIKGMGTRISDINGDGLQDLIQLYLPTNGHYGNVPQTRIHLNTGSGFVYDSTYSASLPNMYFNSNDAADMGTRVRDLNGDGLPDLIQLYLPNNGHYGNVPQARIHMNTGTEFVYDSTYSASLPNMYFAANDTPDMGTRISDINGDGLQDLIQIYLPSNGHYGNVAQRRVHLNTGSEFEFSSTYSANLPDMYFSASTANASDMGTRISDINGDGLQDLIQLYLSTNGYYGNVPQRRVHLNTGSEFEFSSTYSASLPDMYFVSINQYGNKVSLGTRIVDINSDGLADLIQGFLPSVHFSPYGGFNAVQRVYLNTGTGYAHNASYSSSMTADMNFSYAGVDSSIKIADFNGDSFPDFVQSRFIAGVYGSYTWRRVYLNQAKQDFVNTVTNGLGVGIEIDYSPITDNATYTKGSCVGIICHPTPDLAAPLYVVKESRTDNGIGGQNTLAYEYEDAKVHVQGRGLLGFAKRIVTDVDTNIVIETNYKQNFPYIGQVASTKTTVNGTIVSIEDNDSGTNELCHIPLQGNCEFTEPSFPECSNNPSNPICNFNRPPLFVYSKQSESNSYDLNSGVLLTTVNTSSTYDGFGCPTEIVVTTNDVGIDTYSTTANNTYTNDASKWHLCRLTQAVISKTGGAQASPTRKSEFEYNSTTGLLNKEIIEPDNAAFKLIKTYTHDSFGNRISVTESGPGITTRTTQTNYDSKGQFPISVTNALGQSEMREYNDPYGNITKLTGPNLLDTNWEYDSSGRKKREVRADGTETNISYAFCNGGTSCPSQVNGLVSYKVTTTTTGVATRIAYYDAVNRVILTEVQSFDGSSVHVETEFDAQSRVNRKSNPYFGSTATYWTDYSYDDLGRVTQESSPTTGTTTITYSGFEASSLNDLNQTSKEKTNSIGQTIWTEDDNGNRLDFEYDAQGNLITVTDSEGNVTSNSYNLRGFKTQMIDPDMGTWTYNYNVLGELTSQTDAKNQTVSMTYDKLGRLVTRTEDEGTTTWTYDTASKGKGKLASVSHYGGYSRSHTYDSLGRPSSTTTVIGGTSYTTSTTYDAFGRVDDVSYPGSSNFKVEHQYNARGYLEKVRNANNTSEVFYTALAADQFGNITSQTLGSGAAAITTFRSYQQNSGRIHHIDSVVQDLEYAFNGIGNLTQRKDHTQSLAEDFTYDNLNRLTQANVAGVGATTFTYDDLGNITYKSDVGNYTYGAGSAGPHAVTSTSGVANNIYTYDANGNQVSGDGKTITWSSYNKPTQIQKGSSQSNFSYGPERSRYLQITTASSVTSTTTYIDGLYEKVEHPSNIEQKYLIRAGSHTIAIFTDRNSGTDATEYLHRDHLGSIDTITDGTGTIVEKLSFDAFGKRRLSNWNNGLPITVSNNTRGFTGHEMLDNVGLIHMNGRIYDPLLGKFISADPTMQFPKNMQNYNRYSYVLNNPLSYTDPSGFGLFDVLDDIVDAVDDFFDDVGDFIGDIVSDPIFQIILAVAIIYITQCYECAYSLGDFGTAYSYASLAATTAGSFAGGLSNRIPNGPGGTVGNTAAPVHGQIGDVPVSDTTFDPRLGNSVVEIIISVSAANTGEGKFGNAAAQKVGGVDNFIDQSDVNEYPWGPEASVSLENDAPEVYIKALEVYNDYQIRRLTGETGESIVAQYYRDEGYEVYDKLISVRTSKGIRFPDLAIRLPGGRYQFIEVKANTSPLRKSQIIKDRLIESQGFIGISGPPEILGPQTDTEVGLARIIITVVK